MTYEQSILDDPDDQYEWEQKVFKIAELKYGLTEDVMEGYNLTELYILGWTPRRVVDTLAQELFS